MPHRSTSLTGVIIFAAEVCRINGTSSKTTLFYLLRLGVGGNSAPRTASYTIYLTPWLVGYLLLLDLRSTNKLARDHPMIANNILFHYYFLTMTNLWASPLWPLQPQFEQTIGESSAARNSLCLLILFVLGRPDCRDVISGDFVTPSYLMPSKLTGKRFLLKVFLTFPNV